MSDPAERATSEAPRKFSLPVLPDADRMAQLEAKAQAMSQERTSAAGDKEAAPSPQAPDAPVQLTDEQRKAVEEKVITVLKTIYDPEIPINIYELGLIYGVEVTPSGVANITMTLTAPACPVAESLPIEVENRVQAVEQVTHANVNLVWDPPWGMDRMSEAAKLALGLL
jgi:FeS assembly SUF system protein